MRIPIDWIRRILGAERPAVLTLFSPQVASERNPIVRAAIGGATLAGIGLAAIVGLTAFAALMMAMTVIYFLATQVLGLKLQVDPRAFYEQVQRQAAQAYGPN